MRYFLLNIGILICLSGHAQILPLKSNIKVDTLIIDLSFAENVPKKQQYPLIRKTQSAINSFNKDNHQMVIHMNSEGKNEKMINIRIDSFAITTPQMQRANVIGSMFGIIALPTLFIAAGAPIFIVVWTRPLNKVYGTISLSDDLDRYDKNYSRKVRYVNPGGWARPEVENYQRTLVNYQYRISKLLNSINRQVGE